MRLLQKGILYECNDYYFFCVIMSNSILGVVIIRQHHPSE
jgi:hypothetical protein